MRLGELHVVRLQTTVQETAKSRALSAVPTLHILLCVLQ